MRDILEKLKCDSIIDLAHPCSNYEFNVQDYEVLNKLTGEKTNLKQSEFFMLLEVIEEVRREF